MATLRHKYQRNRLNGRNKLFQYEVEDDDVVYLPAVTYVDENCGETKIEHKNIRSPVTVYYTLCGPLAFRKKQNNQMCSLHTCSRLACELVEEETSLTKHNHCKDKKVFVDKNKIVDSPNSSRRLRCRRLAVSAPGSVDDPNFSHIQPLNVQLQDSGLRRYTAGDEEEVQEQNSNRKNTIRRKLIGTLYRHATIPSQKKIEKIAEAAVLATYLTQLEHDKESGSGLLCESCPIQDEASKSSSETTKNTENFFNLLEKMQGGRLDEQRCSFHIASAALFDQPQQVVPTKSQEYPSINDVLKQGGPYPQIIPPPNGGYWIQGFTSSCSHLKTEDESLEVHPATESKIYIDDTKHIYRNHFIGSDHCNFSAKDLTNEKIGHVVMSVKFENDKTKSKEKSYGKCRIILRCQENTYSGVFTVNQESGGLMQWAKELCPELNVEKFDPINSANCWNTILAFDEHNEVAHCKFGLLYQLPNQTKEEELFSNNKESPAFREFLDFLGDRIQLEGHTGFRGGLDVFNGHTGKESIYRNFRGQEVMFHVSTMLPYVDGDRQQLQRKRHIGNDVVSLVFQEGNTPFVPNMITTRFLHAYIVIQPVEPCTVNTRYKVSVTARSDVPTFSPELPAVSVFKKDEKFKDWLYCKLINGQAHCYKSVKFSHMQRRTRAMLMSMLYKDLREGTDLLLDPSANVDTVSISSISSETVSSSNKESSTSFYETFKKLANRRRRNSEELNSSPTIFHGKTEKSLPKSSCDETQPTMNANNTCTNHALQNNENRKDKSMTKKSKVVHENSNNSSNKVLNGTKSLNTLLVDKNEAEQLCLSNSSLNFGSIPEKKEQECYENNNFQNEINFLKKKLLQYENFKKENTIHKKEIQTLRNQIRQFTKESPKLKMKGVTATTEEHLV